jgi:short-subunit dehydrogenase
MAKEPRILAGKTAAITGGARGIGRCTAEAMLRHGMRVAIGAVDFEEAKRTAEALGSAAIALPLDVTSRESFTAFVDAAENQFGAPIDVLVNNAGIMPIGPFVEEDDATAHRMIDINLNGVILGMKIALDRMIPRDSGQIVNISSQAGKFGSPGGATYSATKHAVVGLTEAVRGELHLMGSHVDLTYVMPYAVNTELGGGLAEARTMKKLEPTEVADAIIEAIQYGLVDVYVPKKARATISLSAVLPRKISDGMTRAMKADRVLAGADFSVRRDYELRAARSAPSIEQGEQPKLAPVESEPAPVESESAQPEVHVPDAD